jgi:predicted transcriptional regulator
MSPASNRAILPPQEGAMADNTVKSIFEIEPDEAEEACLDAAADAEIEAGQFVTHDKIVEWLQSWGKPDELPCPKPEQR